MGRNEYSEMLLKAEQDYQEQLNFINDVSTDTLIAKGRHNLTKNTIDYYFANSESAYIINAKDEYDKTMYGFCNLVGDHLQRSKLCDMVDRQQLLKNFDEGKASFSCKYRRRKPGDSAIWVLSTCKTYRDPKTGDVMCFMYSYDITSSVLEQEIIDKITYSEYDFLGIIDVNEETIHIRSAKEKHSNDVIAINNNDYEKACVSSIMEVVVPEQREDLINKSKLTAVRNRLNEEGTYYITYQMLNDKGEFLYKKMLYAYLDDYKDEILVARSDITEMTRNEHEQIHRTEKALHIAQNANMAKTDFMSRVSHDLRTPMNVILGLSALAADTANLAECKDYLEKIHSSGEYLLSLINDTLDVNKIESGKMEITTVELTNYELFTSITEGAEIIAEEKGIKLKVNNRDSILRRIRVDAVHVRQIINNLLTNAIKFTPAGGTVSLDISITGRDDNLIHSLFVVSDNGIGMSKEFQNRMYEPFVQEHARGMAEGEGSGLGLTIVKKLVGLLGGKIEMESQENEGTTFRVYIDMEQIKELPGDVENKNNASADLLRGKRILLCEDHPMNALIVKKLLGKYQCEVEIAKNGKIGVDMFNASKDGHFDGIIMDIRMPIMDGLTATKTIRAMNRPDAAHIPIVAMTANAYDVDEDKSLNAGMNAHLSKPIVPNLLYRTLANLIK